MMSIHLGKREKRITYSYFVFAYFLFGFVFPMNILFGPRPHFHLPAVGCFCKFLSPRLQRKSTGKGVSRVVKSQDSSTLRRTPPTNQSVHLTSHRGFPPYFPRRDYKIRTTHEKTEIGWRAHVSRKPSV